MVPGYSGLGVNLIMKLLCLFVVLLLWQITALRLYTQKTPLLDYLIDHLETFLSRIKWFLTDSGLLATILIFSLILSIGDAFLSVEVIRFIYEGLILWCVLCSLQKMEFPVVTPPVNLEQVNGSPLFLRLPASLWQINYYWISPLFAYVLFGVFGLVFYWAICYMGQKGQASRQSLARSLVEGTVWVPARLLAFAYAVAGNFSKGIRIISEYFGADTNYNQYLLLLTVFVSAEEKPMEDSMAYCTRIQRDACILLLGVYAILVILTWII